MPNVEDLSGKAALLYTVESQDSTLYAINHQMIFKPTEMQGQPVNKRKDPESITQPSWPSLKLSMGVPVKQQL